MLDLGTGVRPPELPKLRGLIPVSPLLTHWPVVEGLTVSALPLKAEGLLFLFGESCLPETLLVPVGIGFLGFKC